MISERYGVLELRQGPGIGDVFESRILYFSAHSDTEISSGGFNCRSASSWYGVTSYFFLHFLSFCIFQDPFYFRRFCHTGNHEGSDEVRDLAGHLLFYFSCFQWFQHP